MVCSELSFIGVGQITKLCFETWGLQDILLDYLPPRVSCKRGCHGVRRGASFLFGKLEKVEGGVVRSLFLKAVSVWDPFSPFITVEDSSGPKW